MKRVFCFLMASLMALSLSSCKNDKGTFSSNIAASDDKTITSSKNSNDALNSSTVALSEKESSSESSKPNSSSSKSTNLNSSGSVVSEQIKHQSSQYQTTSDNGKNKFPSIIIPGTNSSSKPDSLILQVNSNIFGNKPQLTEDYIYPPEDETDFEFNKSGIYENKYAKVDTTTGKDGYILVTYKDAWAESLRIALDESNAHSGYYEKTYHFRYNQGDFKTNEAFAIPLPKTDALYYISLWSNINGYGWDKMNADLGQITKDGTASYQDMVPTEEQIKLTQTASGIYSNKYLTINTNTASKGYVEVEYTEPNGFDIGVSVSTANKNENNNTTGWHYYSKLKGKCKIKAALTYGNGEYTISVTSTMKNESTGVERISLKGRLTTNFTNVSKTGAFLISTGEVVYDENTLFVEKAKDLAQGCKNDFEKVSKIYDWLSSYIKYEETGFTGVGVYTCDLDKIYNSKKGVCYDYAVALAAMLRSQNIPCKVVFGKYTNMSDTNMGHAWNEVYISESGSITTNKLSITGQKWCTLDPTLSHVNTSNEAVEFMNNPDNYTWQMYY